MTAQLLDRSALSASRSALGSLLRLRRTDITFCNVAPDRVRLAVRVWNVGQVRSAAAPMTIQAAPLGAFLPWHDVATVTVPPIEPLRSAEVVLEAAVPATRTAGDFSQVPPVQLVAAMFADDQTPPRQAGLGSALRDLLLKRLPGTAGLRRPATTLPADPLRLLGRANPHWAGNINVLMGRHAVERHLAQALRVYPGRTNLAAFIVGSRADAYQFELSGSGASWDAGLFDLTDASRLLCARGPGCAIEQGTWVPMEGHRLVLLAVCPPASAEQGTVEVHVRQRSSGAEAVVEFSLDPQAAGSGCYAV
jgi:hypothetical protein